MRLASLALLLLAGLAEPQSRWTQVFLLPHLVLQAHGNPLVFCIALPPNPNLVGAGFCLQGAALEVGVCFRATDALNVTAWR